MLFKVHILCIYVLAYIKAELIDDLVDAITHNNHQNLKRTSQAVEKQPPLNIPWKTRKDEERRLAVNDIHNTHNSPQYTPHGHPGYRGGKKRELVIKSIVERLLDGVVNRDDVGMKSAKDEKLQMKLRSLQQQEKLDSILRGIIADSEDTSTLKSRVSTQKREERADKMIDILLTRHNDGGYDGPKNLPWKRRDGETKIAPNLPWKRSNDAPNLPWKRSKSAPNLPWKRSGVAPNLPWKRSEDAPNLPWKKSVSVSAPNLPWAKRTSTSAKIDEPHLPWSKKRETSREEKIEKIEESNSERSGLYKRLLSDLKELIRKEEETRK